MEKSNISKTFNIPVSCISNSENYKICLVPVHWIEYLKNEKYLKLQSSWYNSLVDNGAHYLAPSNGKLPNLWTRVVFQTFAKKEGKVQSLIGETLSYGEGNRTFGEDLQRSKEDYWIHIEKETIERYKHAFLLPRKDYDIAFENQVELLRKVLCTIYKCSVLDLVQEKIIRTDSHQSSSHSQERQSFCHPNIVPAHGIFETRDHFYVVQPYSPTSLHDLVTFSPASLAKCNAKSLFVVYQLLQVIKSSHLNGIAVGDINLRQILVDDKLWIQLIQPYVDRIYRHCAQNHPNSLGSSQMRTKDVDLTSVWNGIIQKYADADLATVTMQWMMGEVSNFEYLLLLNHLAGRRLGDPNHHPVIPWVMDFTSRKSNFRDFTKSKYRLNKGDDQLDQTYTVATTSLPIRMKDSESMHIPHHISDVLSDITYFVYKARQTPVSILCQHVRPNWVPHEYPASMQRLQEWTPDECIPEFFSDPTIFSSIHSDMKDLELPDWCDDAQDFIGVHMACLEGDYVSRNLHHWIDLTFGCKLSGQAAVSAKNVCLQLVDNHTHLTNHGVVQLFTCPHPQRFAFSVSCLPSQINIEPQVQTVVTSEGEVELLKRDKEKKGRQSRSSDPITPPTDYNPLLLLERLESLLSFSLHHGKALPKFPQVDSEGVKSPKDSLISRDLQALACCIVEFLLNSKTRSLGSTASLERRFALCRKLCQTNLKDVPRPFVELVKTLFQLNQGTLELKPDIYGALFQYKVLSEKKLPPPNIDILLQSRFDIFHFPQYFPSLYDTMVKYHITKMEIERMSSSQKPLTCAEDVSAKITDLGKDLVSLFSKYLSKSSFHLNREGVELIVPYIKELFSDGVCSAHAVWSLFSPFSALLGPKATADTLLPLVVQVLDDNNITAKHIKLYHRSFMVQLKLRLGTEQFLKSFATLLVEATAGYKDFISDDVTDRLTTEGLNDAVPVHDGFEVPSDSVIFNTGENTGNSPLENISVASQSEGDTSGLDLNKIDPEDEIEGDILLGGDFQDESKGSENIDDDDMEDTESVSSNIPESQGSTESPDISQDLMGKSVGRVSLHSVSRLIDMEYMENRGREKSSGDDDGAQARSYSSSNGSVHEAIEATDTMLSSITQIEHQVEDTEEKPEFNIKHVASETIKWLSHLLGPVLTAKHFSRNLLRMLALCYLGDEQLQYIERKVKWNRLSTCKKVLVGDVNASEVLACLSCVAVIYGEHIILLQYFNHVKLLIMSSLKKVTERTESGLIGCLSLVFHIIPYLSDKTLMDVLEETIFGDIIEPVIDQVSSIDLYFPSGSHIRRVICYKLIDILYVISMRIGFEMTRQHMTSILQKFFTSFNLVYKDYKLGESLQDVVFTLADDIKIGGSSGANWTPGHTRQGSTGSKRSLSSPSNGSDEQSPEEKLGDKQRMTDILQQLKETFTPEMAHTAYIPFCRLAGGIHMEQKLQNDDLIRQLCAVHDQTLLQQHQDSSNNSQSQIDHECEESSEKGFGVSVVGNKLTLQQEESVEGTESKKRTEEESMDSELLRSSDMACNTQRHLRGNWLAYWEHEVGLSSVEDKLSLKQIRLMTFGGSGTTGHTSSVRSLYVLDNENSFMSASKDKTVKLWSLRSFGDGTGRAGCQWTYTSHKKSVFAVTMLESLRYAASCDGFVHVWDPFMGANVRTYETGKGPPVCLMLSMPAPLTTLLTASSESTLRLLDVRSASHVYDFKTSTTAVGMIRCSTVSPDGQWVAVGYSSGIVSVLDVRTGILMASWKAHEGEVLQIKAYNNQQFVTSSIDQSMSVWSYDDPKQTSQLKGVTEPVHCLEFYKQSVVSATTGNRIGLHSQLLGKGSYTSTRLTSDVFRGVLTTVAVLPLNRLLLLGSDNGQIRLMA